MWKRCWMKGRELWALELKGTGSLRAHEGRDEDHVLFGWVEQARRRKQLEVIGWLPR